MRQKHTNVKIGLSELSNQVPHLPLRSRYVLFLVLDVSTYFLFQCRGEAWPTSPSAPGSGMSNMSHMLSHTSPSHAASTRTPHTSPCASTLLRGRHRAVLRGSRGSRLVLGGFCLRGIRNEAKHAQTTTHQESHGVGWCFVPSRGCGCDRGTPIIVTPGSSVHCTRPQWEDVKLM